MAGRAEQEGAQVRARSCSGERELYFKMTGMPSVAQPVPACDSSIGQGRAAEVVPAHSDGQLDKHSYPNGKAGAHSFCELMGTRMSLPSVVGRKQQMKQQGMFLVDKGAELRALQSCKRPTGVHWRQILCGLLDERAI